ncbi:hypothetical protein EDB85DRAFT_2145644 [Lactarius pseudohatsudake]|nr:hypothetical protein EDB85DRAFT_2145644 [Lactarius pseudohatsudake]
MSEATTEINGTDWLHLVQTSTSWLSPPDPSQNHLIMSDHFRDGSATWFTQGDLFEKWNVMGGLLWVHGKPGSGKSISAIIEEAIILNEARQCRVTYFYFDSTDPAKQCLWGFLACTLFQLLVQSCSYYNAFSNLYSTHDSGLKLPNDDELAKCLKEMLALPMQPRVYVIIDALDECSTSSRKQVLDLIKDLVGLHPNLRICITSRLEADINYILKPLASFTVSLHDEEGQKQAIVDFIKFIVQSKCDLIQWDVDLQELAINTLTQSADGRFRWVSSKLVALRSRLPWDVPRTLREWTQSLDPEPHGIHA